MTGDYLSGFSDAARVHSYAYESMNWAVANGLITGSNNALNPRDNMTRAQVAQFMMNYLKSVNS